MIVRDSINRTKKTRTCRGPTHPLLPRMLTPLAFYRLYHENSLQSDHNMFALNGTNRNTYRRKERDRVVVNLKEC